MPPGDVLALGSILGGVIEGGLAIWDKSEYTPQEQAADAAKNAQSGALTAQAQAVVQAAQIAADAKKADAAAQAQTVKMVLIGVGVLVAGLVAYKLVK